MQWTNTKTKWGGLAQLFHWGIFLLIIGQYSLTYTMTWMPDSEEKFYLYGLHKQMGVTLFLFVFIRLWWRERNVIPENANKAPKWTHGLAIIYIWGLYFLLFAFPLSGFLMTTLGGFSVNYFDLFTIPAFMEGPNTAAKIFRSLHTWFSFSLYFFLGVHILE